MSEQPNTPTPQAEPEPEPNAEPKAGPSAMGYVLRGLAFLGGIGLFVWCLFIAFGNEKNRDGLLRLSEATPAQIALLTSLAFLAIVLNGAVFWATLVPVKRLRLTDVIAVNAIATFLASLPFKISVMVRVAIHRKRDGVELVTVGPWFAAMALMMAGTLGPVVVASAFAGELDARWIAIAGGLTVFSWASVVLCARGIAGERGLGLIRSLAAAQPVKLLERAIHAPIVTKLHAGLQMLTDPVRVASIMGLRVIDIFALAARFWVAAQILGQPVAFGDAIILSVVFFVISVVSPTGTLGAREAGTAGTLALLVGEGGIESIQEHVLLPVVVSGAELIVYIITATIGAFWLRPDKLLKGADPTATN